MLPSEACAQDTKYPSTVSRIHSWIQGNWWAAPADRSAACWEPGRLALNPSSKLSARDPKKRDRSPLPNISKAFDLFAPTPSCWQVFYGQRWAFRGHSRAEAAPKPEALSGRTWKLLGPRFGPCHLLYFCFRMFPLGLGELSRQT